MQCEEKGLPVLAYQMITLFPAFCLDLCHFLETIFMVTLPANQNFSRGRKQTFKLNRNGLSVNYRLQVFHYRLRSPSVASSLSNILIP